MSFTNGQLAQKISDLIAYWTSYITEYANWLGGSATGGPGADGLYPLTDFQGNESLVKSPAKLQDDVDGQVSSASVSASNAATSETNAATSASTATTQAGLADTARIAAELAETNAETAESSAVNEAVTAVTQANLATDRVGYATEWANLAFNTLVSAAAGGNQTDEYSARHWAEVASGFAGDIDANLYARLSDAEIVTGQYSFTARVDLDDATLRLDGRASGATWVIDQRIDNSTVSRPYWYLYDNANVKQWDQLMTTGASLQWRNVGSVGNEIFLSFVPGEGVRIRDGLEHRVYETADVKYISTKHDGTDGVINVSSGALKVTVPVKMPTDSVLTNNGASNTGLKFEGGDDLDQWYIGTNGDATDDFGIWNYDTSEYVFLIDDVTNKITTTGDFEIGGGLLTIKGSQAWPGVASGEAFIYRSAGLGLVLIGEGTSSDFYLANKSGTLVMQVPTGTNQAHFSGFVNMGANLTVAGAIACGTIAGIDDADLLDKSAIETVTALWSFDSGLKATSGSWNMAYDPSNLNYGYFLHTGSNMQIATNSGNIQINSAGNIQLLDPVAITGQLDVSAAIVMINNQKLWGKDTGAANRALLGVNTSNVLELGDVNLLGVKFKDSPIYGPSGFNMIEDNSDTWLRLNNQNTFTSGIYTPGGLRVDGGLTGGTGGAAWKLNTAGGLQLTKGAAAGDVGGTVNLKTTNPGINIQQTDAALDAKNSIMFWTGNNYQHRYYNDAWVLGDIPLQMTRSGSTSTAIDLLATTVTVTGALAVTGLIDVSGFEALREASNWLYINGNSEFTNGVYCPSRIRADGGIEVGASGASAKITAGGAITAFSYEGISAANLLDKTAAETISGIYTHSDQVRMNNVVKIMGLNNAATSWKEMLHITSSDNIVVGHTGDRTQLRSDVAPIWYDGTTIRPTLYADVAETISAAWNFTAAPTKSALGVPYYVTTGYVGGKITVASSAPSTPTKGDIWFDTT